LIFFPALAVIGYYSDHSMRVRILKILRIRTKNYKFLQIFKHEINFILALMSSGPYCINLQNAN